MIPGRHRIYLQQLRYHKKHKLDGTEIISQLRLLFTITGGLGAFPL
jgi:hypothetical protein